MLDLNIPHGVDIQRPLVGVIEGVVWLLMVLAMQGDETFKCSIHILTGRSRDDGKRPSIAAAKKNFC